VTILNHNQAHACDHVSGHLRETHPDVHGTKRDGQEQFQKLRRQLQRFHIDFDSLPCTTQATCPGCLKQVPAEFGWADEQHAQVRLGYQCPDCGNREEIHHDHIWAPVVSDREGSAGQTYSGHQIKPNARLLPRTVQTLCPQCCAVIVGRYFVENGSVLIEKNCPEHGYYRDIINRDVRLFLKSAYWSFEEQPGLTNPAHPGSLGCPSDCGLCGRHQSGACLANIDLTNRCNLNCPICFANANAAGYVYEPSFEQIETMLQLLRDIRPTPATAVQFSGGEPTLHPRFFDIVERAGQMGFSNIQIASNGLKMADYDFARRTRDAGLHTMYLQFDGVGSEVYRTTRGRDIWDKKLAAVENCRRADLKICLVPTIIKTVNDDQVGPIFQFAVDNIDVVSGISYQPVCFTGRIAQQERLRQRYTLGDLAHDIAAASGAEVYRDFYPLSIVMPLSQLLEAVTGDPKIKASCHTECAFGSYFFVSPDKKVYPFPQVLDVEAMFSKMSKLGHKLTGRAGKLNSLDKLRLARLFKSVFRKDEAPADLSVKRFTDALLGMVDKSKGRGADGQGNYRTLLAAGMHFQDRYNYDVERVKRCVIPYATPAGLIPFCAYNSGPAYRGLIEKMNAQ
jgi:uncharacterized radical SAM superfamily Fe-S cluster-containing enzyme